MASVIVTPSTPGTLYVRDPFSFTFTSDYSNAFTMQFTDSSASLFQYTNSNTGTFESSLGAALPALGANLVVDAVTPVQGTVSLYAGDGTADSDDGPLLTSSFRLPTDMGFDASGNMYVADSLNNLIRKIDTSGIVSVYAGDGLVGFLDSSPPATLTTAGFSRPTGITMDVSAGIIYIADADNHAIRSLDISEGSVTTIAGAPPSTPISGSTDGNGTASRFNTPRAIAFDPVTRNLYVADTGNHTIRKIDPSLNVTTLAGLAGSQGATDATGSSARFRSPAGIRASNSIVYVSDTGNHTIRRIASNALVTTYAGTAGSNGFSNATGSLARFNSPERSYLDSSGSLYVADTGNNSIRKIFPGGVVTTYAGTGEIGNANGLSTDATMYGPSGITQSPVGVFYVADEQNNTLRAIVPTPDVRPSGTRVLGNVIVATQTYPIDILSRLDILTAIPPILGNVIQLYQYEPYNYLIQKNRPGDSIRATSSSTEIVYTSNVSQISFASTAGYALSYSYPLQFIVEAVDASGNVADTISNTVRVSPGRWDLSQTPPYIFYRGESIGTSYEFRSATTLSQAFVTPSLPVGITFTQDPSSTQLYRLLGTPLLQTATSNYTFVGRGPGGRIITTSNVSIRVDPERLLLTGGPSNVTGMSVGTPIPTSTFTCTTPTTNTNLFQFSGEVLPSGLTYADGSGNPVFLPYTIPNGVPKILKIQGTPTQAAVLAFQSNSANRLYTSNVRVRASLGTLTADATMSFTFGPTVLFTSQYSALAGPKLFVGIPLTSNIVYKAATYFSNTANTITNITASSLPAGLSLNFVSDASGAYLSGTPTTELTSPALYTITATDSSGNVGSISSYIPVVQNVVTFDYGVTPAIDTSFSFIQSRPLSNAKTGYYTQPILFKTTSLAGFATTFTLTGLEGSGIVLSNLGNGTALLTGTPTTVEPGFATATISVTDGNASASTTIQTEILADVYTFNTFTPSQLAFLQNRVITPLQITATTLSERPVQTYTSLDVPPGLTLSPRGVLSGTPTASTGGTFTVTATNGISSGSVTYTYTVVADSVLVLSTVNTIQLTPGQTVGPLNIDGLSYSGQTVSNFVFSNLSPTYGMTLTSTPGVGILDGVLTNSLPPNTVLPSNDTFQVVASAGNVDGSANFVLSTSNALKYRTFASWYNDPMGSSLVKSDETIAQWDTSSQLVNPTPSFVSDFQVRTTVPALFNSNTFLAMSGNVLYRSTNGTTFTPNASVPNIYNLAVQTGTQTWFGAGYTGAGVGFTTSVDDGVTWSAPTTVPGMSARYQNPPGANIGGVALRYKDGVLMLGGTTMLRSTNSGSTWSSPGGTNLGEVWDFSLDGSRWIAVGSDSNVVDSGGMIPSFTATNTILYSDDLGATWTPALNGYSFSGISVMHGSNGWVSTGIDYSSGQYTSRIRYSTNGTIWTDVSLGITLPSTSSPPGPWPVTSTLQRFGPVYCNGDVWTTLVSYKDPSNNVITDVYQHDVSTDLQTGWVRTDVTSQFPAASSTENRFTTVLGPLYIPQEGPFSTTLNYTDLSTVGGPTFTSPSQTDFIVYQYIPITPITVAATGVDTRLFIRDEDLPVGLTFNTLTGVISGRPIEVGERQRVPVYARDATGITVLTLTFTVQVPRITRQQISASAYTSLVQQYTIVNSAQNARDSRVYPDQLRTLGEFLSPGAPDVTTQDSNPNCVKKDC